MKRVLKSSLSLLLAITIILGSAYVGLSEVDFGGLFAVEAMAATRGTTGDCTWSLDGTVLTVSGNGKMGDYLVASDLPWGTNITKVVIKNGVTSIGEAAFQGCDNFKSIDIPNSVTSIGNYAFSDCTSLKSITIPDSVTSIGQIAFSDCTSLTSVIIPNSVTSIGSHAFSDCTSLNSIRIGDSVTSIGSYAFLNTSYYNNETNWKNDMLYVDEYLIRVDSSASGTIEIKEGTKQIADRCFEDCDEILSIILPYGIEILYNNIFLGCSNLKSISIPESVISIDNRLFGILVSHFFNEVYYEGSAEQWQTLISELNSLTNHFKKAKIYFNSGKYDVTYSTVSDNGTWFHVYNKNVLWESEINNLKSGKLYNGIDNVTLEQNGVYKEFSSNGFFVDKSNLPYDTIISSKGYQKYIIPKAVTKSFTDNAVYNFSVYMTKDRKDGETYISTVFARICNEEDDKQYVDVTSTDINLVQGVKTDVIVTAVQQDSPVKEYYLSQDEKHKVSDVDGIFSAVDLYSEFEENKPVYAYAVLENGKTTEPVPVSFKKKVVSNAAAKFLNACDSNTVSFLGEDGFKITLSDDIPLVGGANITTGMASLPVGIEIQNERIRISIGVDIFKNEINGKKDTTYLWQNFKDSCKSINKSVEESTDKMKTYRNLMTVKGLGVVEQIPVKKTNFDGSFLGYIEAYIIDGEIVFKEVSGTVALEFFFNYKQQFLVAGIPAIYAYVKAGAEASVEVTNGRAIPDENMPFELDAEASLTPSVKIGGGVGVKDAISAGFWGKGSMPSSYNFTDRHLTLGLKGEIGLEAEFFMLKGDVTLMDGSLDLIDHYFNSSKTSLSGQSDALYSGNAVDVFKDGEVSLADRSYLANTSAWLGGQSASPYSLRRTITAESVKISDLQTSVYKNSQTQLVQFGDTMLMVWIEDCADRDDYNRMRLVYSVYDVATGLWNAPQAVADNGKCDSAPSLATDGENVYIAWQNIDYTVSTADEETVDIIMENAEIRLAKYNPKTNAFENVKTITNNSTYDYAPRATVNNGVAEVYWVNSASSDFQKGTLSILKSDFNGATNTVLSGLNYVHCVDSNGTDVSYAMDKDGDTSTTTDIKVYTNSEQVSVDYDGVDASCLYSTYAILDGKKTLFYVDDYNLCYIQNGEEKVVFDSPRSINGNLQVCSDGTKTTAMWLEAGETGTELYTCTYENGEWSSPVQLTNLAKVLSNVALTYFDGKIYGVFNRTHLEEVTSQVDGSIYYKNGATDLCQLTTEGFTDISLSLIDIDESLFFPDSDIKFNVYAENNGTEKITNVSFEITDGNGYAQTIDKTVDLASGDAEFIELTYNVPETISQTELFVNASINSDINEADNIVSTVIGTPDISVGDLSVEFINGVYIVSGIISNKNNVSAENVKATAVLGDSSDGYCIVEDIGTIEANGKRNIKFLISASLADFKENSYYDVTITLTCDTNEKNTNNNQSAVCLTKPSVHFHSNGSWVVDKIATCTEAGIRHKTCSDCGETITEDIPACGHNYLTEWTIDSEANCITSGSKSHHCSRCDSKSEITIIEALGHDYSKEFVIDVEATCTTEGSKSYHCSRCDDRSGETIIDAIGHTYPTEWTIVTEPTCVEAGLKHKLCIRCSVHTLSEPIPASGHDYGDWITEKNATCTEDGSKYKICSNCNNAITETVVSVGHKYSNDWIIDIPASCTEDGSKSHHCSACGNKTDITVIEAVGHNYSSDWVIDNPATCIEEGSKHKSCLNCNDLITETFSALGHNYSSEWTIDKAVSCTEDGSKSHHCTRCEDKIDITIIESPGHAMVDDICQNCGYSDVWDFVVYDDYAVVTIYYGNNTDVVIPASYKGLPVTQIGEGAFAGLETIKSVSLPDSITIIGDYSFYYCTELESITIPDSVTNIGNGAFEECYALTSVTLSDKLISIGDGAFRSPTAVYCYENSAAHNYAVDNGLDYTIINLHSVNDEVNVDYDKKLIRSFVELCTDFAVLVSSSENFILDVIESLSAGGNKLYGTGSKVVVSSDGETVDEYTLVVEGDVNGDSVCDALDAAQVALVSNGQKSIDGAYKMAADSNYDEEISIEDYQAIVNKVIA